jgi:hypothetical protein
MKRFLLAILVCAIVGALVALGMHSVLRDSTGFLADNRSAVIGGVAGAASVIVVNLIIPRRGKGK